LIVFLTDYGQTDDYRSFFMMRRPCVAGRFYPGDRAELVATVKGYLLSRTRKKAIAVIVPHAGYIYSGAVAGAAYSETVIPDDIILIGPNHTGLGEPASVMENGSWETPLGSVEVNSRLAGLIIDSDAGFTADEEAHTHEHSLEVQLPFIQTLNPEASIVPVTVMHASKTGCVAMGKAIARAIKAWGKDVLIVVSSDMNHYEPDATTREKDKFAIDEVLALEPGRLLDVAARKGITMCGVMPAAIAITAARELGAEKTRLVSYATSGEASGDFAQVVGYAGIIIN